MFRHGALTKDLITGEAPLDRKLQGLLLCRLLLAVFFLFLTLLVQARRSEDLFSPHLLPLYLFSCILFLFTIVAACSLRFIRQMVKFAYVQLFFDVGAVTVLIYLSGGLESPFSLLYMPVIISSAVLLYRRGSLLISSACSVSYGLMLDLQYFEWISPLNVLSSSVSLRESGTFLYHLVMNIAGFYLVGFLSGYLAEELQKSGERLRENRKDLHELEVLHRHIVNSITSGLLTVGPDARVLFVNSTAQEILGRLAEEMAGRPFESFFPGLDPRQWPRDALCALKGGNVAPRTEVPYEKPSGERLFLGYSVSVLMNGDRKFAGWVFVFRDLTPFKTMEEHLKRLDRMAFAGKIAAEITHEIKNPLAAMSGAVQMLRMEKDWSPAQSKLMDIIHREIDRINELVTDFLWLARGAHGSEKVEKVAACGIIQEVIELLRARNYVSTSHRIDTAFQSCPVFYIDPHHFRQILWNLLTNALEAMPDGGVLLITVSAGQCECRIDIRDFGTGIAEEHRLRLFEPFFTTRGNGTGLGLSIVYQLVERAGGRIEVIHHEEASGTTFSLFFPFTPTLTLAK